jgi:hypothetical protein
MANVSYLSLFVLSAVAFTSAASMAMSYDSATAQLSENDAVIQATCKWIGTAPYCFGFESDCTGDYDHYWLRGTCGDGNKCDQGLKVMCCKIKNPFSALYWKGSAPFCGGDCNDCDDGDHCVMQNDCGDGSVCWSGKKVLCGRWPSLTKAELEEMVKISEYTKAKEGMAMLMGGHQVDVMEESDPGLVLAYVNYDKVIWEN